MRVLTAQIYNPKNEAFANMELPASYEQLQDTLHLVNGDNQHCGADIQDFFGDINPFESKTLETSSLYQLNYFATIYQNFQEYEKMQFAGLVESSTDEFLEMKTIINLALNVPELDCFYVPYSSDKEIGEFYVDNQLLPQLADLDRLTDEQYEWVCNHLDLEKVGKEMRKQEKGIFTYTGYFVKNEEPKDLYEGTPILPQPKDYVFRLELTRVDAPKDEHRVTLKLPATENEIQRALEELQVSDISNCCIYGYESVVVPQLSDCYSDNDDVKTLNHLAEQISRLDQDNLAKYKAMVEAVECKDIETAISVYNKMEDFTLDRNCLTVGDYVDKVLETVDLPLKEQFSFYLAKDGYGRTLMQCNGIDKTSYGMLIPDNKIKLSEQIQNQNRDMEMTMSM